MSQHDDKNFTSGVLGLIAVDKIGNEVLFLDPISYEVTKSITGFAPRVHELLISEDHARAFVPIYGDGVHGDNPDPGHLIAVIDLKEKRHLGDFSVSPSRRHMVCDVVRTGVSIAHVRTAESLSN